MPDSSPWPTELRVNKDKDRLSVKFDNGTGYEFTAEFLRVFSPSAEVQGHSPEQRQTVPGKKNVRIVRLEPVGNYAVRIVFDDRHDTGLFAWSYLHELGQQQTRRWGEYLDELKAKGLGRG